jgi:hypothetical protein
VTAPAAAPVSVKQDARIRATRSFMWGLLIDVTVAVVLVLSTALTTLVWTKEYWVALGLSLAKSVLQAAVAYVARRVLPPPPAAAS